jgi:hypothetical protein
MQPIVRRYAVTKTGFNELRRRKQRKRLLLAISKYR